MWHTEYNEYSSRGRLSMEFTIDLYVKHLTGVAFEKSLY